MGRPTRLASYWKHNLIVVMLLLTIWFVAGYACSIFGIQFLNGWQVGHLGLGFWMAQQGSIYTFVLIVLVYAIWMDRLDHRYDAGEQR